MEEPGDVHAALADMERKLEELQRKLTTEASGEGSAPPGMSPASPPEGSAPPGPSPAAPPEGSAPPGMSPAAPPEGSAPPGMSPAAPPPLTRTPPPTAAPPPSPARALLRAGPFADIESLGRFERSLRGLDGVEDVVLRGFEGDRALFDVRLGARR